MSPLPYERFCFVIMPFGKKQVVNEDGKARDVDFDVIYDQVFDRAIRAVPLPEGGTLEPRRTDKDFFTGDIGDEMFQYLEYSRIALTDITGLNPNVFYELGVRHRSRQAGTAIFRQVGTRLPFDITQIKAFPYEYQPDAEAEKSRQLITRVLTESLQQNRLDSPVINALRVQRDEHRNIEIYLKDAENALRAGDRPRAISAYRNAASADPDNNLVHLKLGLLLKDDGQWEQALAEFDRAIAAAPNYGEAWREKGIAENKLFYKRGKTGGADGIVALERAIELQPEDFDAHASLGGALKRAGRLDDALEQYNRATEVSRGHSYPLLNALTLAASKTGRLELTSEQQFQMRRAERSLRAQALGTPPYDAPWSLFDLAEIRLFQGDADQFREFAERGTEYASAAWQVKSFRETLGQLAASGIQLAGLADGLAMLEERERLLP